MLLKLNTRKLFTLCINFQNTFGTYFFQSKVRSNLQSENVARLLEANMRSPLQTDALVRDLGDLRLFCFQEWKRVGRTIKQIIFSLEGLYEFAWAGNTTNSKWSLVNLCWIVMWHSDTVHCCITLEDFSFFGGSSEESVFDLVWFGLIWDFSSWFPGSLRNVILCASDDRLHIPCKKQTPCRVSRNHCERCSQMRRWGALSGVFGT